LLRLPQRRTLQFEMGTTRKSGGEARRRKRFAVSALLAVIGAACTTSGGSLPADDGPSVDDERTTIRIERAGGQTGMEGSCRGPELEALDFSAEDVRALVEGQHETTLAHRPLYQTIDADLDAEEGRDMTVDVRFVGEPQTFLDCGGSIRQDVEVTLAFEDPPLDVIFEETLFAFSQEFALVQAEIDPAVAEPLELSDSLPDEDPFTLTIGFTPAGVRGSMDTGGGHQCGVVVFPAGQHCEEPTRPEIDMDEAVNGVSPRDVLAAMPEVVEVPVQWSDGTSTTLSVAIEGEPRSACGDWPTPSASPDQLTVLLDVRVATEDGRVDVVLPAEFGFTSVSAQSVEQASSRSVGWDGSWDVVASALLPRSALTGGDAVLDFSLPEEHVIWVHLNMFVSDEYMPAELRIAATEIDPDGPVIDAPIDVLAVGKHILCFGEPQPIAEASAPDNSL
jgi:hypothetical protein